MSKKQSIKLRLAMIKGIVLVFLLVNTLLGLLWPMLRVQAGSTLPPRNDPPTATQPDDSQKDDDDTLVGAYIELHVQPNQINLWAVVQWQDHTGNWHNVDGWQGALESDNYQRWWVAQKDFDTGPFHWLVTQGPGGSVLGTSKPFSLPAGAGEVVPVMVPLK